MIDFKFSRDWQHAGSNYKDGDVIRIPEYKAAKLKAAGAGSYDEPKPVKEFARSRHSVD